MSGMNKQGRPTSIANTAHGGTHNTFTGNKALELEEALLFEIDNPGLVGSAALTNFDWLGEPEAGHAEFLNDRFVAAFERTASGVGTQCRDAAAGAEEQRKSGMVIRTPRRPDHAHGGRRLARRRRHGPRPRRTRQPRPAQL